MSRKKRLAEFRTRVSERAGRLTVAWVTLEQGVGGSAGIDEVLRELHTLKGEASMLGFAAVADVAHALESTAESATDGVPDEATSDHFLRGLDLLPTLASRDRYEPSPEADAYVAGETYDVVVGKPSDAAESDPEAVSARTARLASVPISASPAQLDHIRDVVGDLMLSNRRLRRAHRELRDVRAKLADGTTHEDVATALSSIDAVMRDDVRRVSAYVDHLEEAVRELRTVPVSTVFEPFPRLCRDLAHELGKRVTVECTGGQIGADREVLQALTEPLLHLVRNAIDHGVEPPDQRTAAGKPALATIRIVASIVNQALHIEVADDGAGIDVDAVRARAIERGIVAPAAAAALSDESVLEYLFTAGMSTRDEVTKVSGRGVGLDVVRDAAQSLGGTLAVGSARGTGTRFHLVLPISIAIAPLLMFRVGPGDYALQARSVVAIVDAGVPVMDTPSGPTVRYDGHPIALYDLAIVLDESPGPTPIPDGADRRRLVIVDAGNRNVAFAGTRSHRHFDGVLKTASDVVGRGRLVTAGVALEDGGVALVLDPVMVTRSRRRRRAASYAPPAGMTASGRTILIVDDSPVIRDVIAEALRMRGANVIEAGDGREALECLARTPDVDLIVTDLEMPRMDGLELIRAVRELGGRRIPAVVVSTRTAEADKLAARDVGADTYLSKDEFSQGGLWSVVARHLETP